MTGTRRETTEAHRAPVCGRILVFLALALLCGVGGQHVAAQRPQHGSESDRLAGTPRVPVREACDRDPAWAALPGWRAPHAAPVAQRSKRQRGARLRGPAPAAELPDTEPTQPRRDGELRWVLDAAHADAAVAAGVARRSSAPDDRASSLRAAFAAVIARRGPPVRPGSRTL